MDFLSFFVFFLIVSGLLYLFDPAIGLGFLSFFLAITISDILCMLIKIGLLFLSFFFFLHVYIYGNYDQNMSIFDWVGEHLMQYAKVREWLRWNAVIYVIAVIRWFMGRVTACLDYYGYSDYVKRVAFFLYKEPYNMKRAQKIQLIKNDIKRQSMQIEHELQLRQNQHVISSNTLNTTTLSIDTTVAPSPTQSEEQQRLIRDSEQTMETTSKKSNTTNPTETFSKTRDRGASSLHVDDIKQDDVMWLSTYSQQQSTNESLSNNRNTASTPSTLTQLPASSDSLLSNAIFAMITNPLS